MPQKPPERPPAEFRVLLWLTAPPRQSRVHSALIVLGIVGVIGWLDYVSGFWLSLQFFYLLPIVLAVSWLGWRAGCATVVLCVGVRLVGDIAAGIFAQVAPAAVIWNRLFEMLLSGIIVWVLHSLISLQRQLEDRVQQRTTALEQAGIIRAKLQTELFEISRRERSAIGHELHDSLGQHLTATSIATNILAQSLERAGHPEAPRARSIAKMVQEGIGQARQIARGLLLSNVEPGQLIVELEEMLSALGREHQITCRFSHPPDIPAYVDVAITSHLYYIAREAASNAVRHGRPTRLTVVLIANRGTLDLTIEDDGSGLSVTRPTSGLGLRIMSHRAELIGGEFSLEPAGGGGTRVRCLVPMPVPVLERAFP